VWDLKLIKFWGPLKEKEYKIRFESAYLFRMRKMATNYKLKGADKYHKLHKLQKYELIFLIVNP